MSAWCSRAYCRDPLTTIPHLCSPEQHHAAVLVTSGVISLSNSQCCVAACLWFPAPGLAQPISSSEVSARHSISSLGLQQPIPLHAQKWSHNKWQGSSESLADSLPLGLPGKEEESSLTSNSFWSPCAPSTQCFSLMLPLVLDTALSELWMLSEQSWRICTAVHFISNMWWARYAVTWVSVLLCLHKQLTFGSSYFVSNFCSKCLDL